MLQDTSLGAQGPESILQTPWGCGCCLPKGSWVLSWIHQLEWGVTGWKTTAAAR